MPTLISHGQSQHRKARCAFFLLFVTCLVLTTFMSVYKFSHRFRPIVMNKTACRPFTASDNRSFFERDSPQSNLPRQTTNLSSQLLPELRRLKLVVLACGRDVAVKVDNYRQHIEPILNLFDPSSRLLIFESDSSDKTVLKLRQWSRAHVYAHGRLSQTYPSRTDRLALCRNTLLSKAHTLAPDYILFTDMDIFATSVASFLTNFQYATNDWNVMTASSTKQYYDIWALRTLSDSVMNYDVWHRVWQLESSREKYCSAALFEQIIGIHQKGIPIEHDLIEVRSAFCGAGLYKANATHGCLYDGRNTTCEHVPFHLCVRDKNRRRIFVNPAFQIA